MGNDLHHSQPPKARKGCGVSTSHCYRHLITGLNRQAPSNVMILARLRLRPRINIRCHSGAKPSAEGRWLRTRPFETLASLAPQGEVLVLRSARSARLEAPGSPPLRTKIGFSRFWQTYCRSRLKPRSAPPRNDAVGKLDTFASTSLTQAELDCTARVNFFGYDSKSVAFGSGR